MTPSNRMATSAIGDVRSSHRRRRSGGFNAIELSIAIVFLGMGAAGVIGMHRASVLGNTTSRSLDVANGIAREWMERLRADVSNLGADGGTAGSYFWTHSGTSVIDQGWFVPDQASAQGLSPAFDLFGRDVPFPVSASTAITTANPPALFCTHVRLDCLTLTTGSTTDSCLLLRATVRVFWPRSGEVSNVCTTSTTDITTITSDMGQNYHFVYATTALRQTER